MRAQGIVSLLLVFAAFSSALSFSSAKPVQDLSFDFPENPQDLYLNVQNAPAGCFSLDGRSLDGLSKLQVKGKWSAKLSYDATCGFCGKAQLAVGTVSSLPAKVPLDVPCKADVLLVTSSKLKTTPAFFGALRGYLRTLASRKLTAQFSVIDSALSRSQFGTDSVLLTSAYVERPELAKKGAKTGVFPTVEGKSKKVSYYFENQAFICATKKPGAPAVQIACPPDSRPNAVRYALYRVGSVFYEKSWTGILTKAEPVSPPDVSDARIYLVELKENGDAAILTHQPSHVGSKGSFAESNSWAGVKGSLDLIQKKVDSKYLILLGGDHILPVPQYLRGELTLKSGMASSMSPSDIQEFDAGFDEPSGMASDDYYGTDRAQGLAEEYPSRIVSRFPTSRSTYSDGSVVAQLRSASSGFSINPKVLFIGQEYQDEEVAETRSLMHRLSLFFYRFCKEPGCLLVPPYCVRSKSTGLLSVLGPSRDECTGRKILFRQVSSTDLIFVFLHEGTRAYAPAREYDVFGDRRRFVSGDFNLKARHPIVYNWGCGFMSLDVNCPCASACSLKENDPAGLVMFDAGARTLLGHTRKSIGITESTLDLDFTLELGKGKTVGEAFLASKNKALRKVKSAKKRISPTDLRAVSDATELFATAYNARTLQLWGDPTVKVNLPVFK